MKLGKNDVRCILMARYGMLDCARNFKTHYKNVNCKTCKTIDDEAHRLNECMELREINWAEKELKIDFDMVYSQDIKVLREMSGNIKRIWKLTCGSNVATN